MTIRFACRTALAALIALGSAACDVGDPSFDEPGEAGSGAILLLGDSILDYNRDEGASVGDVLRDAMYRPVTDRAEGGAHFVDDGYDIRSQYTDGDWSWVVFDGGGNDLNDDCGCGRCDAVLDEIISDDGRSGALPDFVAGLTAQGIKVMVMGYYDVPADAQFGFDQCEDAVSTLRERQLRFVERDDRVFFFDPRDVVDAADLDNYDDDRVHPSPLGSSRLGEGLAEAIRSAE